MVASRRTVILVCLLLGTLYLLQANITTTIKIANTGILYRLADESFALSHFTGAGIDFKSGGKSNARGELECTFLLSDRITLAIPRAYLKLRFPWFDLTAGKTRVSWGQGFAFNAGDIVFDSMSPLLDLSGSAMHDQTAALAALTAYFGNFTFLELLFLPGAYSLEFPPGSGNYIPTGVELGTLAAGARFVTKFGLLTCETGYLYRGEPGTHTPYLSFQGALFDFLDFYLAANCSFIQGQVAAATFLENIKASCGFFKMLDLGTDITLNLRLEAGLFPDTTLPDTVFDLYLYPEIVLALPDNFSGQLRALIDPVAASGVVMAGINWNAFQGFNLGCMLSAMFGDENDAFGWGRERDFSCILSLEYLFGE